MRKLLLFTPLFLFFSCGKSDQLILQETIEKLNAIETIAYDAEITLTPIRGDEEHINKANCYFDFTSKDQLIGAKYHFVSENGDEQVFDGNKLFQSSVQEERILYIEEPRQYEVHRSVFSSGSLLEVKKLLPLFIKDATITTTKKNDTTINGARCYRFDFLIPKRYVSDNKLFNMAAFAKDYVFTYQIAISKDQMLPVFVKTKNSQDDRVVTYVLSDIKTAVSREDSIWDYKRFSDNYLKISNKDYDKRKRKSFEYKVGFKVPGFKLKNIDGTSVTLPKLEKKLTLLEFWFPNCTNCIKAVPDINEIQKKYRDKGLVVYGIEFTRSRNLGLKEYIEAQKIEIENVYGGREMATDLGIYAAPTFMLLNEEQVVVYRRIGFDKEGIIKSIEDNL